MPYHVQRNGQPIGEHDEQTMLALLNAGALKLTDTYLGRGMAQAEPLASLFGDGLRWRVWTAWFLASALGVLVALSFLVPVQSHQRPPRLIPAGGQRVRAGNEAPPRGVPVIRGSIVGSSHPAFPFQRVESCASHSRVAVLALDGGEAPIGFGAGFIVGQGDQVVTTLKVVSGASAVELRFANGQCERATGVTVDEETGLAVLRLGHAGIPFAWSENAPWSGQELFIAGNVLSSLPALAQVRSAMPGKKYVCYKLDTGFASSFNGSAVLDAAGDVCAVVAEPESGLILRGADIRGLLQGRSVQSMGVLAMLPPHQATSPIAVDSAEIEDGRLMVQLRNTGARSVNQVLLHIRYHELPREAGEVIDLERELAAIAVEASTLEYDEPGSDLYFQRRQQLREVTARLEAARCKAQVALQSARQRVYRTDVLSIEAALPPGLPQRITIEAEAGSRWGAVVTVLDVTLN